VTERRVLRMGNPDLHRVAEPVPAGEIGGAGLETLIEDLWDTMAARGGIGLAAPQIGARRRVVVFGLDEDEAPGGLEIPRTVLVNPRIEVLDDTLERGWEGCLSLPGMRGLVPRYRAIRYAGLDPRGDTVQREVSGYHARVVQHECDHLDGVVYPMRMPDLQQFGFEEEISLAGRYQRPQC